MVLFPHFPWFLHASNLDGTLVPSLCTCSRLAGRGGRMCLPRGGPLLQPATQAASRPNRQYSRPIHSECPESVPVC